VVRKHIEARHSRRFNVGILTICAVLETAGWRWLKRRKPALRSMSNESSKPTYRWPWFVLAAVILAIVLAAAWMYFEVRKTKRIRDLNSSPSLPLR